MTTKERQLLFKDLSARLPYECMLRVEGDWFDDEEREAYDCKLTPYSFMDLVVNHDCDVKPYLRPMSSMTEEEKEDYVSLSNHCVSTSAGFAYLEAQVLVEWLNFHHFDFRNLIERGLALEAPEDMYKIEQV